MVEQAAGQLRSPTRALVQCLLEGLPAGEMNDRRQLAGDLGPVRRRYSHLGGDAAAREPVKVDGLEAGGLALDPLVASRLRLVGAYLGGPWV